MRTRLLGSLLLFAVSLAAQAPDVTVRMKTNLGDIDVTLLPSVAPLTVANFLKYKDKGAYTNTIFHRSVPGFIIQAGGYTLSGNNFVAIPADPPVRNEFNLSNTRGTIAMAKLGNNPNSATNEFFFNLADNSANLNAQNGGFTVFGRVANATSQAVVDRIASQPVPSGLFQSPFDAIPLINYRGGSVSAANIVVIQSITTLDAPVLPAISSNGVVHPTAFGGAAKAAPGSYIEIYGTALAGTTRSWTDADFSGAVAPITLDQVQVTVGGVRAFVNFVSPTQINVQVPEGVASGDAVPVVVTFNGVATPAANIAIREYAGALLAPAAFKVGDTQYVAALHSTTGKFVNGGNIPDVDAAPAVPGETLLFYGTGFGPITPNFPALGGRKASGQTMVTNPVSFKFGDTDAKVAYMGLAPNFVGLYQFNVEVPSNAANGDQPLTVTQGGAAIEQKLVINVRATP